MVMRHQKHIYKFKKLFNSLYKDLLGDSLSNEINCNGPSYFRATVAMLVLLEVH
jgi:hypothetical protein